MEFGTKIVTCSLITVQNGLLQMGNYLSTRCSVGPAGVTSTKTEGDGATPAGIFPLRRVLYRADRVSSPVTTNLPQSSIHQADGWCDDPAHREYNRPIQFPFPASAEHMWREDHLYDICIILGHNDAPPIPGRGSAIFFHLAKDNYEPTQGCVAVSLADMLTILERCDASTLLEIKSDHQ